MAQKEQLFRSEKNIIIGIVLVSLAVFGFGFYFHLKSGQAGSGFRAVLSSLWVAWQYRLGPVLGSAAFALIGLGIYSMIRYWPNRSTVRIFQKPLLSPEARKKVRDPRILKHWNHVAQKANTGRPENLRLAVLEADALVDYFLKTSGYQGEHMADRLGQIAHSQVKSLERVWKAHRLRNDIVHTPGYVVSPKVAEDALKAYRDFLLELDAF